MPRLRGIMSNLRDRSGGVKPGCFYVLRFCFDGGRGILVGLMSDARRFPPPWSVEEQDACFVVVDHSGQKARCGASRQTSRVKTAGCVTTPLRDKEFGLPVGQAIAIRDCQYLFRQRR
jgi:hypothetical protein